MSDETITPIDPNEKLESSKQHARKAAEDLKSAATAKAQEFRETATAKAQELRERANHQYSRASERARSLREDGEQYVRENPLRAVFTALGVGFLIGLIFRR